MTREYKFVAGDDSLEAFRQLRHGWAGWQLVDGVLLVRLRTGGTVRAHVDTMEIEPGFEAASVVADYFADDEMDVPVRDSPISSDGNDVVVFRGITWIEQRPDLGHDTTIQFSGNPLQAPENPEAICDVSDALAVIAEDGAMLVRIALKPGHLEVIEDPEQVEPFLEGRGYHR